MFKFNIGQEVKHKGHRKNCIIRNQIKTTDCLGTYNSYDVYLMTGDALSSLDNCLEYWLEEGHRIE